MNRIQDHAPWERRPRGEAMMNSEEVEAMLHLHALGWGLKRIAREFGCSRNTVRRYLAVGGWVAYSRPARGGKLEDRDATRLPSHPPSARFGGRYGWCQRFTQSMSVRFR